MSLEGSGQAHGAVTVVNAIPGGRGAAAGIELTTQATVQLQQGPGEVTLSIEDTPSEDTRLAKACIEVIADAIDQPLHGHVSTRSQLPIARGLKSSSVAANAIVLACFDALDAPVDADRVLELGVQAARQAGVTVTGALDDAAASLLGGLVVTDNREDVVMERKVLGEPLPVLLLVPAERHHTEDTGQALDPLAELARGWIEMVQDGRWQAALTLNGLGVAAALGQALDPTYRALQAGALAAGTTGTGPAIAAICEPERTTAIRRAWEPYPCEILETRLTDDGLSRGVSG